MKQRPLTYIKSFGIKLYIQQIMILILSKFKLFPKLKDKIRVSKNKEVHRYLKKTYGYLIDRYQEKTITDKISNKIWIFWYQGMEKAPEIIKNNLKSIQRMCPDKEVIVITKDNINKYFKMPEDMQNKIDNHAITLTHLSDILRMNLLSKYGGYYMDATMYLTANPFKNDEFFSVKIHTDEETSISKGMWVVGFIGGKNQRLYDFAADFFNDYWQKENVLIDYFLDDFVVAMAYQNIPKIKKVIDKIPYNNEDIFTLQKMINNPYDEATWNELNKKNCIHRLTYKEYINYEDKNNYYHKKIKIISKN